MDRKALREHIDRATKLVESWPSWKQDILARSSQPTLTVPRTPVNNQSNPASQSSSMQAQPRKDS